MSNLWGSARHADYIGEPANGPVTESIDWIRFTPGVKPVFGQP